MRVCVGMSGEIRYYKGKHKVRVLTKSRGNWVVEALDSFEDVVYGQRVNVKVGERRIVVPNLLFKMKSLPSPVKEHVYELKMEKKLKRLIAEEEKKQGKTG
jgi:hypothetical protein